MSAEVIPIHCNIRIFSYNIVTKSDIHCKIGEKNIVKIMQVLAFYVNLCIMGNVS